jgi:hypothetical protein
MANHAVRDKDGRPIGMHKGRKDACDLCESLGIPIEQRANREDRKARVETIAECAVQSAINDLGRALEWINDPRLENLPCSNLDASGFLLPAARACIQEAVKQLRAVSHRGQDPSRYADTRTKGKVD